MEPTNSKILEAINGLTATVMGMKEVLDGSVEMTASTKDYLDGKLGVTRGHANELVRKEDERVSVPCARGRSSLTQM